MSEMNLFLSKTKTLCTSLLFLVLGVVGFSAERALGQEFVDGYVVKAPGDTLRGELRVQEWSETPQTLTFRPSRTANTRRISVDEAAGYGVEGYVFERHAVTVDERSTNPSAPTTVYQNIRSDTLFLQQITEGALTLFFYRNERKHFYLQQDDGTPEELTYYVQMLEGRGGEKARDQVRVYRSQLARAKTDACRDRSTDDLDYEVDELVAFVRACNGIEGADLSESLQESALFQMEHAVYVSATRERMKYKLMFSPLGAVLIPDRRSSHWKWSPGRLSASAYSQPVDEKPERTARRRT